MLPNNGDITAPCDAPYLRLVSLHLFLYATLEHPLYQAQQTFVRDSFVQHPQQLPVIDRIKGTWLSPGSEPEAAMSELTISIPFEPRISDTSADDMDENYKYGTEVNTDINEGKKERVRYN
jgi:hypothetical protein